MTAAALGVLAYLGLFAVAAGIDRAVTGTLRESLVLDALQRVSVLLALPVICAAAIGDTVGRWVARRAR